MYESMYMTFWKWHSCRDRIQISLGLELRRGVQGNFMGDATVLYLDCGVDYITMHFSKCVDCTLKRVNFTVCELYLNFKIREEKIGPHREG